MRIADIIDTPLALQQACHEWQHESIFAMDTEFIRRNTYYSIFSLLQIRVNNTIYIVDLTRLKDFTPLHQLCIHHSSLLIMHACREDLHLFHNHLGAIPQKLFDTQIGAAFLGQGAHVSYRDLVRTLAGIELEKSQTLSNWLQRPLTAKQRQYVVDDVRYLHDIYERQCEVLKEKGRLLWCYEEYARLRELVQSRDKKWLYNKIRRYRMDEQSLVILSRLYLWREQKAQKRNMPRQWVLSDQALATIAREKPATRATLMSKVCRIKSSYSHELLDLVHREISQQEQATLWQIIPLSERSMEILEKMFQKVKVLASIMDISPHLLASRHDCEWLLRLYGAGQHQEINNHLRGWRYDTLHEPFWSLMSA